MKPWVTVAATVVLITALSGCGHERAIAGVPASSPAPAAGVRPPDAKVPFLEPDPANNIPITDVIELVFEERRHRGDGTPADSSQLVVLTALNHEFLAQGTWNSRHIQIRGKVHVMEEGILPITLSYTIMRVSGPLQDTLMSSTTLHLKPQIRHMTGGFLKNTSSEGQVSSTVEVWFRPHVTMAP